MRATHISPTAFGVDGLFGGGERYPLELARALSPHVSTRLVTFGPRAARWREPTGLEVVVLRTLVRFKGHPVHPVASGLAKAIRDSDIIHAHHMRAAPSRQAALLGALGRRPICVTDHGLGAGGWMGLLPRLFDGFLTVSDYSARALRAPEAKRWTIYGGADPGHFRPHPATARRGVLFVGRITPHKGIDRLLQALPPDATLTIAGTAGHDRKPPESRYSGIVRAMARGRDVRFTGRVDEDELPRLHRRARVFVLPSVHTTCFGSYVEIPELLGLSILEAMASGTPVIASRIGGVPEIVVDGETGFLIEPGDTDELRERIAQLLRDERLSKRMGAAGRERVVDGFTWEHCALRCLSAYEELSSGAV